MPRPSNYHEIPKPSSAVSARNRLEPGALDERTLSRLWRPRAGSLLEVMLSTISRVSLRLIDRVTGDAYSADELEAKILEAVGAGTDPAWEDISGKPTTLAGYGITDAPPTAITRTAEQGAPNKNGVEVAKVGGPFVWEGFYALMPVQYNGHPVFSNIEDNGNFRRVIFRSVGGRWRNISTVALDLDDQGTWEASTPDFSSQSTTSALPYPDLVWLDDDSQVDADLAVSAASTTPVTPSAIGQLCIVDASDVYVAAQVDPPIWLGPLN